MLIRPVPSIVSPPTPIGVGGFRGADSLILDFYSGVLDPRVTFTGGANRTYIDSLGVLQDSSTNVARFDHLLSTTAALGLSIWTGRENGIRYNTMGGASPGTPGTSPTNWTIVSGGTTVQLVAVDTINGIKYVSYRFSGTPTSDPDLRFETTTGINALTTQVWTESAYVALVAGDLTNIAGIKLRQSEMAGDGTFIRHNTGSDFKGNLTSTLQRFDYTVTLVGGGAVAHVNPRLLIDWDGSGDIDLTLRIGLPQEEQGAGASPVIKTTNAAVTATADVPTMTGTNFSDWYNASEGTFLIKFNTSFVTSGDFPYFEVDDDSNTDRLGIVKTAGAVRMLSVVGGVEQANVGTTSPDTNDTKAIFAYKANDFAISVDSGAVETDTSGTLPAVDRLRIGGDVFGRYINGNIGLIEYHPYPIIPTTLQERTQ